MTSADEAARRSRSGLRARWSGGVGGRALLVAVIVETVSKFATYVRASSLAGEQCFISDENVEQRTSGDLGVPIILFHTTWQSVC